MNAHPFFRTEALKARQTAALGEVVLAHPLSFAILTGLGAAAAAIVLAMLFWGQYTRKLPVNGQLVPDLGLAKIYPRQSGVVTRRWGQEGQPVAQGAALFEISDEMRGSHGDTRAAVSEQMNVRRLSLRDELTATRGVQLHERQQLERRQAALQTQATQLDQQIATQGAQLALARQDLQRYRDLVERAYLSKDALLLKQTAVLEQQGKLQAFERERTVIETDRNAARDELAAIAFRQEQQLEQLSRQQAREAQDFAETEVAHRQVVVAPQAGIVASVNAELGQHVDPARPVLVIVPEHSVLQAHLYVPSRAIGFIRVGTTVNLRYRTYPYEIFGLTQGKVSSVSTSAMPATELESGGQNLTDPSEPVFRVTVALPAQQLAVKGAFFPLHSGMLVDADILVERKALYRWILDPVYSAVSTL